MKSSKRLLALCALLLSLTLAPAAFAQVLLQEDFTGTTSTNTSGVGNWLFFNGACLTAGTSTSLASPAVSIPACTTVLNSYYVNSADHDVYLMGGAKGFLGGTTAPSAGGQIADPDGQGALRFTNGKPYGNQQRGAIVSTNAYPTTAGIQVTFKTVTYGGTGADGISFYLMDGCVPVSGAIMPLNPDGTAGCSSGPIYPASPTTVPAIGATGGSLAYTCSNTNGPAQGVTYDGLTGGYLGLGIDEYGNFLNQGDNTGSGFGFVPGRIGLRGAGAISWPALNTAYGTDPGNTAKPFYPSWLAATCAAGALDKISGTCGVCPAVAPTNTVVGLVTTATTTTTVYTNAQCANTTTQTQTTADTGCTTSGYALQLPGGNPICVKTSGCTYNAANDGTYPNGVCTNAYKTVGPPPTCNSGYSLDAGLGLSLCVKAPTTNTNFKNTVVVTTSTTNVPPTSSSAYIPNTTAIQAAMQKTCSSGHLWNYLNVTPTDAGRATLTTDPTNPNPYNTAGILDYPAIPGANLTLPAGNPLYNGGVTKRSLATTIFYNLKITTDGYLSLSYAYGGGTYQPVITNQNIKASNGPVPPFVRFGFAGSTGGATNVHEIMCFKSAPADQSASSAGVNEKQSAKVESGTFAYFAYYDQNNWVGRVTANSLLSDKDTGVVSIVKTPAWDASCVLTGVPSGQKCDATGTGPAAAMDPKSRVILTYNGGGVPFEWSNLSGSQQTALDFGDPSSTQLRLNYLRGDRTNEVLSDGTCMGGLFDNTTTPATPVCFRARTDVLGDIVDSSPTWVGPPQSPFTATWQDRRFPSPAPAENSGSQTYLQYVTAQQKRANVVYVGSNDGMMHGFRSGGFDDSGNFTTANTPNDGQEVLAYMPGSLLLSASTGGACASLSATGSVVQNIHGETPPFTSGSPASTAPACVNSALDFSNIHYGHNFYVDATPGTGDLYYNGAWHTWLVSGLGAGGAAIFALDVTNPGNFSESNAASLVMGEWTPSNLACANDTATVLCANNMGATFGTPIIRRLHDGKWALIFGNGFGSASGDGGIYVMVLSGWSSVTNLPVMTTYYLSTGKGSTGTPNGIAYVTSADLDGDHVTDYVYAGDLLGNLWRFDLNDSVEGNWKVTPGPMFTTTNGQPITTAVTVSSGATTAGGNTIIVAFGTGNRTQFNNASLVKFAGQPPTPAVAQALYGVWDWNLTDWNSKSTVQYAAMAGTAVGSAAGVAAPYTLGPSNLMSETFHLNADGTTRDIAGSSTICWAGSASCASTPQFGWTVPFIGTYEQVVYNPQLLQGVFTVNSIVPANNIPTSCVIANDAGFTYAISVMTGAVPPNFFVSFHDTAAAGIQTDAVGTSFPVTSSTGALWLVSQTVTNQPILTQVNPGTNGKGRRLTWVQLR